MPNSTSSSPSLNLRNVLGITRLDPGRKHIISFLSLNLGMKSHRVGTGTDSSRPLFEPPFRLCVSVKISFSQLCDVVSRRELESLEYNKPKSGLASKSIFGKPFPASQVYQLLQVFVFATPQLSCAHSCRVYSS